MTDNLTLSPEYCCFYDYSSTGSEGIGNIMVLLDFQSLRSKSETVSLASTIKNKLTMLCTIRKPQPKESIHHHLLYNGFITCFWRSILCSLINLQFEEITEERESQSNFQFLFPSWVYKKWNVWVLDNHTTWHHASWKDGFGCFFPSCTGDFSSPNLMVWGNQSSET